MEASVTVMETVFSTIFLVFTIVGCYWMMKQ